MPESIIVIGNGASLISEKYGKHIDMFDIVGRINNYQTDAYEDYSGKNTNIWFNGANQGLKKREISKNTKVVVLVPLSEQLRKGAALFPRVEKRLGLSAGDYEFCSMAEMKEIENSSGITRPTTGFNAIMWALKHYDDVTIHGFDFFIDSKTHYNDPAWKRWLIEKGFIIKGGKHSLELEKDYVENLIKIGKVKQLRDLVESQKANGKGRE